LVGLFGAPPSGAQRLQTAPPHRRVPFLPYVFFKTTINRVEKRPQLEFAIRIH
jgi:hypothetical protein